MSITHPANSLEEVKKYFESLGYCVLSVKKDWKRIQIRLRKKINDNEFITFNQELIALLKAGYPVHKAIENIVPRIKNQYFKETLLKIRENVREGKSLAESFTPYTRIFSPIYPVSLLAGERSGNLVEPLKRFLNYFRTISQTKKRVKSALIYPTLLIIFSFILLSILFYFVLPRFFSFYKEFKAQLPFITRAILSFSSFLESNIPYILGALFIIFLFYLRIRRTDKGAFFIDAIKLKIPYISVYLVDSNISLFSRTLSLLLASGLSLLSAVNIALNSVFNKKLKARMKTVPELIKNGESLTNSLEKTGFFPPLSIDMIKVGETSASLPEMLGEVADFYDQRIETRISTLVSLIEPVLIIFMGILIASMLLSVYLPIFNLVRVAR